MLPLAPVVARPVEALGLRFSNALGLAAGIDRSGDRLEALSKTGIGHVEVGSVNDSRALRINRTDGIRDLVVGANIASRRSGLNLNVLDDYADLMGGVWHCADYIAASLGKASLGRNGDMLGIDELIERIASTRDILVRRTGRKVPVLVKIRGAANGGSVPRAVMAARRCGLDGVVLVTSSLDSLRTCCRQVGPLATVISVGGIGGALDARARLAAGASLVQIHNLFVTYGVAGARACLGDVVTA